MQLSIIIPVYNVEQYIRPCVESIYRQGLDEDYFEVILVNDGTIDDSFGRISDIISAHSNIVVLEQSNQGLSAARNTGLSKASGQYVLFVDSDDLLIDKSLGDLLTLSSGYSVDMIIAGFVKMNNDEIDSYCNIPQSIFSIEKIDASEYFLKEFNPRQCYVWRVIFKMDFLRKNSIRFIPGIYFEDIPFITECYLKADKCLLSPGVFYIYRQRSDSIVSSISMKKLLDMNKVIEALFRIKNEVVVSNAIERQLLNTIYATFSVAVWYLVHDKSLYSYREEYIKDIKNRVPYLIFAKNIKQIFVSLMINYCPYFYLRVLFFLGKFK